jgi:hypothetical protein
MSEMQVYEEEQSGPRVGAGLVRRDEFGAEQLSRSSEIGSTALATAAKAEVEARYIVAARAPRNWLDTRSRLLAECDRPRFADVAIYRKPIGGGKNAEGLSIRFAEAAHRTAGNIHVSKVVISDDAEKRTIRVTATDLEANNSESVDVVIDKTVEKSFLKEGQRPLGTRINSYGKLVYLVPGSEGELLTKQKAEAAKAKREVVLGIIPGDIIDECKERVRITQERRDAADPQAALKKICDAFASRGVKPSDLETYLGHAIEGASPAELMELRQAYVCIDTGEATWPELIGAKHGGADGAKADPKAQGLRQKLADAGKKKPAAGKAAPSQSTKTDEMGERQPGEDG